MLFVIHTFIICRNDVIGLLVVSELNIQNILTRYTEMSQTIGSTLQSPEA